MTKTVWKDMFRLIHSTKTRFLSLLLIVTIGVAFFIGVTATSMIMANSVSVYQKENAFRDIIIYSNYGFEKEDVDFLNTIDYIDLAEGSNFVDVIASTENESLVTRIHAYDANQQLNKIELIEGRLPENDHEVLSEHGTSLISGFPIGTKIQLSRPENDLEDYINVNEVTVVGMVDTPLYLNEIKENSTINNQNIKTYLFLPSKAFTMDYYSEINIKANQSDAFESFSDDYYDYEDELVDKLEIDTKEQAKIRANRIIADAEKEYADGKKEYEDGVKEYEEEIAKAEKEIEDARKEIQDGEKEIQDGIKELQDNEKRIEEESVAGQIKIHDARAQIDAGKRTFEQKEKEFYQLYAKMPEILDGIKQCDSGITQLQQGIQQLEEAKQGYNQIQEGLNTINESIKQLQQLQTILASFPDEMTIQMLKQMAPELEPYISQYPLSDTDTVATWKGIVNQQLQELDAKKNELEIQKKAIEDALQQQGISINEIDQAISNYQAQSDALLQQKKELETNVQQLEDGKEQLLAAEKEIQRAYEETVNASVQLDEQVAEAKQKIQDGWQEIADNQKKIADAKIELEDGERELEEARIDGKKELDDAYADLIKARNDLDALEEPEWMILDRSMHYGTETFRQTIQQMEAIAAIFPLFFLAVAALVCLTTMTRLVDEERGQIGIFRAIGFTRLQCASKYLVYALLATLIGELLGTIIGLLTFPTIIYNTWRLMYILPPIQYVIPIRLILISDVLFLAVMLLTTAYTCWVDMKDVPSQLLRPKAPKLGRTTIMEHIPFLWNRLTFTWKVTIRNLFRYKKRFIMTVIGVAGCCALLVTGFGIRDSINGMVDIQFDEIMQYDGIVSLDDTMKQSKIIQMENQLKENPDISKVNLLANYTSVMAKANHLDTIVQVEVLQTPEQIHEIVLLRERKSHKPLSLTNEGIVISERLSENYDVKVGDTIRLESKNGIQKEAIITGICEMYINHVVYMTKEYYESLYGISIDNNAFFIKANENVDMKDIQKTILEFDGVKEIEFFEGVLDNFNNMVKGLDKIVWTLLISSMCLAFVVLGNLTNINISERKREIATLKVLGFRKLEVLSYIYKENNVLTIIGAFVGIPLGIMLHHYIMRLVEMDNIMFGREVYPISLLYAVLLTVLFGMMVNFFMRKKLTTIEMVESLKSVE